MDFSRIIPMPRHGNIARRCRDFTRRAAEIARPRFDPEGSETRLQRLNPQCERTVKIRMDRTPGVAQTAGFAEIIAAQRRFVKCRCALIQHGVHCPVDVSGGKCARLR